MTAVLILLLGVVSLLMVVVSHTHLLYRESLRLRPRDLPAMEYFKEHIHDRIGLENEDGALAFSLIRHTLILCLALLCLGLTLHQSNAIQTIPAILESGALAWVVMMVTSYVAPQFLYRRTSGNWMIVFLPALRVMAVFAKPLLGFLEFLQSVAELGETRPEAHETATAEEHIDALIDAGAEEGVLEEDDRQLIQSVVAFGDKRVREVMTPRPSIVAVSGDKTLEEARTVLVNEQYSRLPVYEGTIDNVIGFIHARDVFELDPQTRAAKTVKAILRKIHYVPETKLVKDLMREMQKNGQHMAVVVDEYGNTAGLATMEDLVEEILGEIRDEHEPPHDVTEEPDGSYVVSGSYDLDNLEAILKFRPAQETEATTVGGLVTEWLGYVPHAGESVEREGIRLEVLASDDFRVERVRISRSAGSANGKTNGNGNGHANGNGKGNPKDLK